MPGGNNLATQHHMSAVKPELIEIQIQIHSLFLLSILLPSQVTSVASPSFLYLHLPPPAPVVFHSSSSFFFPPNVFHLIPHSVSLSQ